MRDHLSSVPHHRACWGAITPHTVLAEGARPHVQPTSVERVRSDADGSRERRLLSGSRARLQGRAQALAPTSPEGVKG